jgi:hypothetical protein
MLFQRVILVDQLTPAPGVARLLWIFVGPAVLFLLLIGVATRGGRELGALDLACLLVTLGMLAARGYEFRQGTAQTSTGEPATADDWRRYLIQTPLTILVIWGLAKLIAWFL